MSTKRTLTMSAALLAVALGISASAFASPPRSGSLLIQHQTRGCHSWSLNGGVFNARQAATLGVKGTLTIRNNDVMPHTLFQVSGPKAQLKTPLMAHMSATAKVTFPAVGVYVFTTKAGEDYMKGIKTIGEDNVLRLVVHVV